MEKWIAKERISDDPEYLAKAKPQALVGYCPWSRTGLWKAVKELIR
jgi:hypothetical protein